MKTFIVTGRKVSFEMGTILALIEKQAESRKPFLKDLGKGKFEVLAHVEFKQGEKIGIEEDQITKYLLMQMEEVPDQKKEKEIAETPGPQPMPPPPTEAEKKKDKGKKGKK